MRKTPLQRCLGAIETMTHSEREVLLRHLIAAPVHNRLSARTSLRRMQVPLSARSYRIPVRTLPPAGAHTQLRTGAKNHTLSAPAVSILTATLCAERTAINLALYIHTMADRLLYELQPPVNLREKCPMISGVQLVAFKNKSWTAWRWCAGRTRRRTRAWTLREMTRVATVSNLARPTYN